MGWSEWRVRVAFACRADLGAALATVRAAGVPSTVVWGDHDRLLPAELGTVFAQQLDAAFVPVDGDHDWPLRHPYRFAHLIMDTLSPPHEHRHERRSGPHAA